MIQVHPVHRRLIHCQECGLWAGVIERQHLDDPGEEAKLYSTVRVRCLCDGPLCRRCGRERILCPSSSCYDARSNSVWQVSAMAGMARCRRCRDEEERWTVAGNPP